MKIVFGRAFTIAAGALALGTVSNQAVSIDFSSFPNSKLVFDGAGNFRFGPLSPTPNFQVDTGSAAGFYGSIGGTFAIGDVTTIGPTSTAPIAGNGTFTIFDGATPLVASITLNEMSQTGTGAVLNVDGAVNVTAISYAGTNPDLVALRDDTSGSAAISFQFALVRSIEYMKTHRLSTTFSGSVVSTPDLGTTVSLLGLGMIGMAMAARREIPS
jgi:hypothetical protein